MFIFEFVTAVIQNLFAINNKVVIFPPCIASISIFGINSNAGGSCIIIFAVAPHRK